MKTKSRINEFIELVSNIMEAYSTSLFLTDQTDENHLNLYSFHSLSKNINKECTIEKGEGIIGWVFREQRPVLANYFDKRDATTLKLYKKDEDIKSLLAIPLAGGQGVLCVDSKKSYIFTEEREKILNQMSQVLLSILQSEKEIKEKNILESLLSLSINTNEILVNTYEKNDFIKNYFTVLIERLHLYLVIFVIENKKIFYTYRLNKKNIFKELSYDYLDRYGLVGWVLKNERDLLLEKISSSDKSFIINKNEPFDRFTNFLCIPLVDKKSGKKGAISFVKENNERWLLKEKKTLALISQLFFKECLYKK